MYQFKRNPRPYQQEALNFIASRPASMLALDMGCGKSKVTIDFIQNFNLYPALIVCPKSVVGVWPKEFRDDCLGTPMMCVLDVGTTKTRLARLQHMQKLPQAEKHGLVVVINYESAILNPMAAYLVKQRWAIVVLDESHRIKSPSGKTSWLCKALGKQATRRLCLTGTPLPHSPLDAYGQYRFLNTSIFGTSFVRFRLRYAELGGYQGKQIKRYLNMTELEAKMKSIMFRVKSDDVLDLPSQTDVTRTAYLSDAGQKLYNTMRDEFVLDLKQGLVTASNALTRLLRLQQLTSGFARPDDTGEGSCNVVIDRSKASLLSDVLEDIEASEPIVIFCRFRYDLDLVHEVAAKLKRASAELSGRRHELVEFQRGKAQLFAVQMQSGGVGIDLTRARYCIYFSLGFSLGDYLQSRKRVHRPGQSRPVTYIHLLMSGTVDEKVMGALRAREDVVNTILEGGL